MRPLVLCLIAGLAGALPGQKKTLLFPQWENATSLDATAETLGEIHEYDIAAVTPDSGGATMFAALPIAATSVMVGDPDSDRVVAEYFNDQSGRAFAFMGCLVKNADKGSADRRKVFWSVHDTGVSGNPSLIVFTNGGTKRHKVRTGDFVRIGENGSAEFFVTQELIMKAAGTQTGTVAAGASDICQDANGNLYYSPPLSGHFVSDGTKQVRAEEGAIVWIPKAAITYDAAGNVSDVNAGSARLVVEMGSNQPSRHLTIVTLVTNSKAHDRIGQLCATTNANWPTNLAGLAIDPNGGTFTSSTLTGNIQHPNLIFAFDNITYRGTIFSTRGTATNPGSIAVINGVAMGTQQGNADGSWIGAKGQNDSPTLNGLEIVDWGLQPKAPYGMTALDTQGAGGIDMAKDKTFALDFQGLRRFQPIILLLGIGPAPGKPLLAIDLSAILSDFRTAYVFNLGPFVGNPGLTNAFGRFHVKVPVPQDPNLKGLALIWQSLYVQPPKHALSNPIVTEFR